MNRSLVSSATGLQTSRAKVRSEPLFFPSHGCPLYGMFCRPTGEDRKETALIACHGVGLEHAITSRMTALAVRRAAELGYPALLYHSRGHGDSAGDFAEVTFESLVEDALSAEECLFQLSDARRVVWLGLRLGALVAVEAAIRHPGSVGLVLWEPVASGTEYFRQLVRGLQFSAVARGGKKIPTFDEVLEKIEREGKADIHACYLHAKLYLSIREISLVKLLERWTGPVFLAQIRARLKLSATNAALVEALESRGAKVTITRITEEPGWQFLMWDRPWTSQVLLDNTMRWLDELA
jgi:pimeloyl-ACP methyl ester carboxylesterase